VAVAHDALRRERYWGEDSIFYNPERAAALGVIFASVKDHDGERRTRRGRAGTRTGRQAR
jgi:hypothetical protein